MLRGFKDFIIRGNIIDLAIAVVIGVAFGGVIAALVEDFLTPLIAAMFGKQDFSSLTFTINDSIFRYGHFINAMISFLAVAAAIYFIVVVPLKKLADRRKIGQVAIEETPPPSSETILLTEIRDLLRRNSNG